MNTNPLRRGRNRLIEAAVAVLLLGSAGAGQAQANPFARGPDPTSASLNATTGPFAIASVAVPSSATGFGSGTIYYPTAANTYGVIALCPGFVSTESAVATVGRRLASHGFVVITMNTNSTYDQPASRATQIIAALNYVVNNSNATVRSRVDSTRLAAGGHSMGGGGTLIAVQNNPSLKAAYPMTPYNNGSDFGNVTVPTMIIGADGDSTAPVTRHARPFYASLPAATKKAYGELNGASHTTPTQSNTPIGRYAVSWMKRFVDNDARYSDFLCGAAHASYATPAVFDRYQQNCPY